MATKNIYSTDTYQIDEYDADWDVCRTVWGCNSLVTVADVAEQMRRAGRIVSIWQVWEDDFEEVIILG